MQSSEEELREGFGREIVGLRVLGVSSPEPCREQRVLWWFFVSFPFSPWLSIKEGVPGSSSPWLEHGLAENSVF